MGERLVHVLIDRCVGLVEHAAVFGLHVPEESLKCHGPAFSGWKRRKEQRNTVSGSQNLHRLLYQVQKKEDYTIQLKQKHCS